MSIDYWVGIDLGTTNSAAFIAKAGTLTLEPLLFDGEKTFPSAVSKEWVGKKALEQKDPNDLILSAKSWLLYGPDNFELPLSNPQMSPEKATEKILNYIHQTLTQKIGCSSYLTTITVPASFTDKARQKTVSAAYAAGFTNVELLEEPLAAFYTLLAETKPLFPSESRILIVDVGGGTTDFSIIDYANGTLKRTKAGSHLLLGGDNMDLTLLASLIGDREVSDEEFSELMVKAKKMKESEGPAHPLLAPFFAHIERKQALDPLPGLKKVGLPYAREPSIVRHLSHFLSDAPQALVVNGGVFKRKEWAYSLQKTIEEWFNKKIDLFFTPDLDLSCAKGAIYAQAAKQGLIQKVEAGLLKSYFLEIEPNKYLSLLPKETSENHKEIISLPFLIPTHTPLTFKLFTSPEKYPSGNISHPKDLQFECLLAAKFKYGKTKTNLPVDLEVAFSATGHLNLTLLSKISSHKIDLVLDTRSKSKAIFHEMDPQLIEKGQTLLKQIFLQSDKTELMTIGNQLEQLTLLDRLSFPLSFLRSLFDSMIEVEKRRLASPQFSEKWWQWAGFFLRPGMGYPLDEERAAQFYRIALSDKSVHEAKKVALRRAAAGLKGGQQKELLTPFLKQNYTLETYRLIASFERLDKKTKKELLIDLLKQDNPSVLACSRLGSRRLIYGSLNETLSAKVLEELLPRVPLTILYPVLTEWFERTGVRELDIGINKAKSALLRLTEREQIDHLTKLLYQEKESPHSETLDRLHDSLPTGLEIDDMAST